MAALADKRAELDLQVSLLAEHELTRLVSLVRTIADHHGIDAARDVELEEITQDIAPETVLEQIEVSERVAGAT